ncbi:MAG TPA: hypothetical protein VN181_10050 [Thermoanaerobaculia bacterium]|nr:hypothetical protein [Thermoanaerobaculia bacterium]
MQTYKYLFTSNTRRDVIRICDDYLEDHTGRRVPWQDVIAYRAYPRFAHDLVYAALGMPKPRLTIYLRSGQIIRMRGDILVSDDEPIRREGGVPVAFKELVSIFRARGVDEWKGPKEEYVLIGVARALFVIGGAIAAALAVREAWSISRVAAFIVGGVILAQLTFVLSGRVARRLRSAYIAATDHENDAIPNH